MPGTLHARLIDAIRAEADNARAGKRARIVAKMNALLEPTVIAALYEASHAGVKIDLIVQGVCSLKPGVEDLSENITVRSDRRAVSRASSHLLFLCQWAGKMFISLARTGWIGISSGVLKWHFRFVIGG